MDICAVIMAAGEGERMHSKHAKVAHKAAGKPLISWVQKTLNEAGAKEQVYIVGHRQEQVRAILGENVAFVMQEQLLGTGHAVMQATPFLEGRIGGTFVLCGDAPLIRPETLLAVQQQFMENKCSAIVITADADDPTGYGRIIRDSQGKVAAIVEDSDADASQKMIREINASMYLFDTALLLSVLGKIGSRNQQNEYYLTDSIAALIADGYRVDGYKTDFHEIMGVNDRIQLQKASELLNQRCLEQHMRNGVSIVDPHQTWIEDRVLIGRDVTILPGCHLSGRTVIGDDCVIGPRTELNHVDVGCGVQLKQVTAQGCSVGEGAVIGPYVHLRQGTQIEDECLIGNFAEIKNSRIGKNCQISHQCYIGDADIGEHVTIGSNCSIANYDGMTKSRTTVGSHAFVGSNCSLISPVIIEDYAYIAAGSVITETVPQYALAIGRTRQIIKEDWVLRRRRMQSKS